MTTTDSTNTIIAMVKNEPSQYDWGFRDGFAAGLKQGARRERKAMKYKSLIRAGTRLSNICFNLKQNEEVRKDWRESMDLAQTAWDFAVKGLASRTKREGSND